MTLTPFADYGGPLPCQGELAGCAAGSGTDDFAAFELGICDQVVEPGVSEIGQPVLDDEVEIRGLEVGQQPDLDIETGMVHFVAHGIEAVVTPDLDIESERVDFEFVIEPFLHDSEAAVQFDAKSVLDTEAGSLDLDIAAVVTSVLDTVEPSVGRAVAVAAVEPFVVVAVEPIVTVPDTAVASVLDIVGLTVAESSLDTVSAAPDIAGL